MELIYAELPSRLRATELQDIYFANISWMYNPISFDEVAEIMDDIYNAHEVRATHPTATAWKNTPPHKLSVLFLVFALGALMDLNLGVSRSPHSFSY